MGEDDMAATMRHPLARLVAVCDVDTRRAAAARDRATRMYQEQGESNVQIRTYSDYREILANPEIDAVIVSTPDHWHALPAIEAAIARKHLYVQKPLTYGINEAIALRDIVRSRRVILQTGSQQRSERPYAAFRIATEMVRNGRIGKIQTVRIGVGLDRVSGRQPAVQPVPTNLDYERWLGPAPEQPYMEGRVHPQNSISGRPGWITTEDFGLGMITNWGAHHIDIAQWGVGMELSGPTDITAQAEFMTNDVWTVHRTYHVEMLYPNGVQFILDNTFENGIRFEGTEGWVFCARGAVRVTASDPTANDPVDARGPLRASNPKILEPLEGNAKRWQPSQNHYFNWIDSVVENRQPIAPVEEAARSVTACAAAWIGMKLQRKVTWDPVKENFGRDAEANALCERKARKPEYDFRVALRKA
jgi:predicted dehydrogenase